MKPLICKDTDRHGIGVIIVLMLIISACIWVLAIYGVINLISWLIAVLR